VIANPVTIVVLPKSTTIHGLPSDPLVSMQLPLDTTVSMLPSTTEEADKPLSAAMLYAVELCDVGRPNAAFALRFAEQSEIFVQIV
jgi:hypothetical protein